MALVVKDRVKVTTATTGTGTLTLGSAVAGFQAFSAVLSNADTTYYAIFESSTGAWEVGLGTYASPANTLARTTILESSNAGSAINLTAGNAEVFITQPAEKAVYLDASGYIFTADGRNLTNLNASNVSSGTIGDAYLPATISSDITGNAATATKWATGRTISLTGDVTGTSGAFDGSGNLSFATTIAANSVALGTDTTGNYVATGAVSGNGLSGSASSEGATFTVTSNATNVNTPSTIVFRDASGNFSAGTITANLTGTASNADLLDGIDSKDYSRKVMETASGGVSDANYWAKIATYTITGNFNDGTFLYFFMNEESGAASSAAIVAVTVRTNNVSTGQANSVSVSILGMHQTDPFNDNAFKLVDNGSGTPIELWVQKNSAFDHISVYEHSAHMEGVSVAYNNGAAWQASEPVGTGNNVRSAGLVYRNSTVWNAGNDGSGSGLDADLLDGVQGSSFLRSDAADTASGVITFTDRIDLHEIRTNTGQEVIINAGESATVAAAQTGELLYVNAENGLEINASPDNWASGWAGRVTHLLDATIASFGTNIQLPQRIQHTGDTDTYMEFHAADQWRVVTGGVERLEATNSGIRIDDAFTLPTTDGTSGQALVTNGSGTVTWGSAGISTGKAIAMAIVFG